ncbi:MAG: M56 family metallopeptidase [Bacteroidia bacterium]
MIPWITFGWILGVFIFTARWLGGIVYIRHLRTHNIIPVAYLWQLKVNKLARKMGIGKTILLRESSTITVPMVIGHLKPVILIPIGILNGLTPAQLEAIFVHELAHIQRYDFIINLILSQVEALFFYHPAFWWISARIRDEREHCCDDIAVGMCKDPVSYARTLADLEAKKHQPVHLSMGLAGRKNHLLTRIQRIVMPDLNQTQSGPKVFFALLLVILMTSTAWISPSSEQKEWSDQQGEVNVLPQVFPGMVYQVEPNAEVTFAPQPDFAPEIRVPQIFSVEVPAWNFTFVDSPPPSFRFEFPENMNAPRFPDPVYYQGQFNGNYFRDTIYFPQQFDASFFNSNEFQQEFMNKKEWKDWYKDYIRTHKDQWEAWAREYNREYDSRELEESLQAYERVIEEMLEQNFDVDRTNESVRRSQEEIMKVERELNRLRENEMREKELQLRKSIREQEMYVERVEREARMARERELVVQERLRERQENQLRNQEEMLREREHDLAKLERLRELEELAKLKELEKLAKLKELKKLKGLEDLQELAGLESLKGLEGLADLAELKSLGEELAGYESKMKGLQTTLAATLRVDSYIDSRTETINLKVYRDMIKVNGREIKGDDYDRYMELMESYGLELSKGSNITINLD